MRYSFLLLLFMLSIALYSQERTYPITGTTIENIPTSTAEFTAVYFKLEAGDWSEIEAITFSGTRDRQQFRLVSDGHSPGGKTSQILYVNPDFNRFELTANVAVRGRLHVYDAGRTAGDLIPQQDLESSTCPCGQPPIVSRADWCPAGNCDPVAAGVGTTVTHLIVHHSAGTNNANDWAAIVRAIYTAHTGTNGWDDIGYNYLIDPNGVIYIGRGNDIRGAHFCGDNTGTMGTCMLGTFTNQAPTDEALRALEQLLAWKACDREIDPEGTTFHAAGNQMLTNIAGHRQGCATQCPGDSFFPLLGQVRENVADTLSACEPVATDDFSSEPTIQLYPNPGRGDVRLAGFSQSVEVKIYALTGRLLFQGQLAAGDFIEANIFKTAGIYLAVIEGEDFKTVRRIIRE